MPPSHPLSRPEAHSQWQFVGPASSFLDIEESDGANLSQARKCDGGFRTGCKAFYISNESEGETNSSHPKKGLLEADLDSASSPSADLKSQILVFKYKGKFHAVDHVCYLDAAKTISFKAKGYFYCTYVSKF